MFDPLIEFRRKIEQGESRQLLDVGVFEDIEEQLFDICESTDCSGESLRLQKRVRKLIKDLQKEIDKRWEL